MCVMLIQCWEDEAVYEWSSGTVIGGSISPCKWAVE